MPRFVRSIAALVCAVAMSPVQAQSYPVKPVFVVLPFAGGTGLDSFVRAVAQNLSEGLKQKVLVENKAGANSIIGTDHVAKSPPDGYTLLVSTPSLVNNATLYSKLPFDTVKDFTPVTGLVTTTLALGVHPGLPAKDLKELIELAKKKPGQFSYASLGIGSTFHLTMELFESMANIKLNHIPYKGSPFADAVAGHVDMMFSAIGSVAPFARSGKLKMMAMGAAKRHRLFPDVPTIAEAGVPGFEVHSWYGLHAPGKTPRDVVTRLNSEAQKVITQPAFRAKYMDSQVFEPLTGSADHFAAFLDGEMSKWRTIIRNANVRLD